MRAEPKKPWLRAHEAFLVAWCDLHDAHLRRGRKPWPSDRGRWLFQRWGVRRVIDLTPAQARAGSRQLHALRGAIEGRYSSFREYPRQWRRNLRRAKAFTAIETATNHLEAGRRALQRRASAGAGGVMPTDSALEILPHFSKGARP